MRFLLLISIAGLFASCSSSYRHLTKGEGDLHCVDKFRPEINTVLYNTYVNVVGNHLSGLLIIKKMPDSSLRLVFTSETGFKFFDVEFSQNNFKVYYILNKMDKKSVIKTLRKDFQLVLMNNLNVNDGYVLIGDSNYYYTFPWGKDHYYYITDAACKELLRMERGNKRKKVVEAVARDYKEGIPDSIHIRHTGFEFEIGLKRINNYAQ
jgi:hypothetical protein